MDVDGSESLGAGECDEAELRQLLVELEQLTKQQTSYTTVMQSLLETVLERDVVTTIH